MIWLKLIICFRNLEHYVVDLIYTMEICIMEIFYSLYFLCTYSKITLIFTLTVYYIFYSFVLYSQDMQIVLFIFFELYTHAHAHTYAHTHTHTHVCVYVHVCVRVCTCMRVCMCVTVCVPKNIFIYDFSTKFYT